ncbi:N-acetylmuramoyl-L-alanine amidase [hydrothermal vent metagenome]|uniref:N-acetylmuramoyl-L-alanine amidase n=1 Tax=hydrothermal vent metagenome TaxID=652676 RepID=A0A1W1EKT8_9ZZZZ
MAKRNRVIKLFLLLFATFFISLNASNHLKSIKIDKGELKLIFENKIRKSNISTFTLNTPYRRVFDFKNAQIYNKDLLKNLYAPYNTKFRLSQFKKNIVRLVIESDKVFRCSHYSPILSSNIYNISLPYPIGYNKNSNTQSKPKPKPKLKQEEVKIVKEEPINIKNNDISELPWYKKLLEGNSKKNINKTKKSYRIVIDAGHGGHDGGATSGGIKEKDIVLQIAQRVKRMLLRAGYTVYMTRDSDHFVKLSNRTKFSNRRKADIFVSIHANAVGKNSRANIAHGIETYFLSKARTARAKRVAAKENRALLSRKDYHSRNVILNDVINGPKIILSNKLAIDVHNSILEYTRTLYPNTKSGGVRPAPFWVLVGAQTPSILVEVGYITNPRERAKLRKASYQTMIAKGIVKGIRKYLKNRERELN